MILKRKVSFERLKFILEHLNKNVDVLAIVDSENHKIFVKIGTICYEITQKTQKILNESKNFYEILRFLNEKAIKIEDFKEI